MNKKGLPAARHGFATIFAIIIAILVIGGVVYIAQTKKINAPIVPPSTPATSSTIPADWKTYRNEEFGFEFSYPKDVTVTQEGNVVKVHDTRPGYAFDWNMDLYQNTKKMGLTDWINFQFNSFSQVSDKDCKIVPSDTYGAKVNIKNAHTVLIDAPSYGASCDHVRYYTISPDKLTIMGFDFVQADPILYQDILSTFTFTSSDAQAADWKTYQSEKVGFEFSYPNSLKLHGAEGLPDTFGLGTRANFILAKSDTFPPDGIIINVNQVSDINIFHDIKTLEQYRHIAEDNCAKRNLSFPQNSSGGLVYCSQVWTMFTSSTGQQGLMLTETRKNEPLISSIFFMRDGLLFQVSAQPASPENQTSMNQIAKTFRFLNQ